MRLLCPLLVLLLCGLCPAQTPTAAPTPPAELKEHTSTLGRRFVAIPGSMALFAVHETSVADWQTFLAESKYEWSYLPHFEQGQDHPAVGITLQDAQTFCAWLTEKERAAQQINSAQSYRVPTQAEWDAAVGLLRMRKPDTTVDDKFADERTFPWGLQWPPPPKTANLADQEIPGHEDGFPFTAPVGSFKPSAEGLYDLSGNVWEWCWDPDIRAEQTGVLRGGSWAYFRPECLASAYRYAVPADLRMSTVGFRCVFEDRQRTAAMLASAESEKEKIRAERRIEMMGASVDKAEIEAMRKKFATSGEAVSNLPDPAKLLPATSGKPFQNILGMEFMPTTIGAGGLLVGRTEVRVQDYEAWLKDSGRSWPQKPPFLLGGAHPAAGLTWDDAGAFCEWLTEKDRAAKLIPPTASYRLPTDIEWSHLASLTDEPGADPEKRSGANKTHFPWSAGGSFPPPSMTVNLDATRIPGYSDSFSYTAPVMSEPPGSGGIQGLGGNVAEWCADPWPPAAAERVIRGGSWLTFEKDQLLTSARRHAARDSTSADVGFRCILELSAAP